MKNVTEHVYLDNPLEIEKLPQHKLTFELISETENVEVWRPFGICCLVVTAVLHGVHFASPAIRELIGINVRFLPGISTMFSISVIAWVLLRRRFVGRFHPWLGLVLVVITTITALLNEPASRMLWLLAGVTMFYATGETAIHFALVKERRKNPFREPNPDGNSLKNNSGPYDEVMLATGLASFAFLNSDLIPGGIGSLFLLSLLLYRVATQKNEPLLFDSVELIRAAIREQYQYPDASKTGFGLLRSPLVDRIFRPIPVAICFSTLLALSVPELVVTLSQLEASFLTAISQIAFSLTPTFVGGCLFLSFLFLVSVEFKNG